jgi:hypothetical protein
MFAITFHHMIVGIASGTGILMGICALLAWLGNFVSNLDDFQQSFDKTSLLSSILCFICMPLAIFLEHTQHLILVALQFYTINLFLVD